MKSMKGLFTLAVLPLAGCYNIFLVNVGGVTKQASSVNQPLAPEVQCAALTGTVQIDGTVVDSADACLKAVKIQRQQDRKGSK